MIFGRSPTTSPPPSRPISSFFTGAVVFSILACGAPESEPVRGEIGDVVAESLASGTQTFDHSLWSDLLAAGVREGLVDYVVFEERFDELDTYLESIASVDLAALAPDHLMALLINAYNAYTVESILDHPGIASIREIDGVWDSRTHTVGGFELTLDNIEHNVLRPYFKDPRIHMAVNCASQSCAPLPTWAFTGENLESELESWTRDFFRSQKYLRIEDDGIRVTKLLEWYGDDFTQSDASPRADSLVAFVRRYVEPQDQQRLDAIDAPKVRFLEYDWALNQAQ